MIYCFAPFCLIFAIREFREARRKRKSIFGPVAAIVWSAVFSLAFVVMIGIMLTRPDR